MISTVQDSSDGPTALLHINKFKNRPVNGNEVENEESISDADLENIVGVVDSSELQVLSLLKIFCGIGTFIDTSKENMFQPIL